jgi:hypothetical protein
MVQVPLTKGICQQCGFRGLLRKCPRLPAGTIRSAASFYDLPSRNICITCFATPLGHPSENQIHRRLATEENEKS